MRIPAALTAASLAIAPATPVEQLLVDVSAFHNSSIDAINSAETDDEVRDALTEWRKELISAADELDELREDAAEDGLTEEEEAEFDEAADTLKRERAGVRKLRAELLPDDPALVVPAPLEGLGGLLGTTMFDELERSEHGDLAIVFGVPGASEAERETAPETTAPATTTATTPTEPTASTSASTTSTTTAATSASTTSDDEVALRVERLQDTESESSSTTTETESTTASETTSSSTTTDATTAETTPETTTSATTTSETTTSSSSTRNVLQNRTTSATSSSSTSSSSTTSRTSSTTTTEEDDERDDDLADTGTPMRALIGVGTLTLLLGATLVLLGAARRGARR